MSKSIKVVDKDIYGRTICNSLHLDELYSTYSKTSRIEHISMEEALTRKWGSIGECLLLAHSFQAWDTVLWQSFLDRTKAQIFVIPSEILNKELMIETFTHPHISKIILNNPSNEFRKNFKSYGIENQKIKYISIPSSLNMRETRQVSTDKRIIISPGILSAEKNYKPLLIAAEKIIHKHLNAVVVLLFKSSINATKEEISNVINKVYQDSLKLRLKSENFVILLDKEIPYESYLQQASIILAQQKYPVHMYDGTIIDGVALHKPIVAASSISSAELASKQDLGVHLYDVKDEKGDFLDDEAIGHSIFQNCSIILENSVIEKIMIEQNTVYVKELEVPHIVQQYFNLVKRSKNA